MKEKQGDQILEVGKGIEEIDCHFIPELELYTALIVQNINKNVRMVSTYSGQGEIILLTPTNSDRRQNPNNQAHIHYINIKLNILR